MIFFKQDYKYQLVTDAFFKTEIKGFSIVTDYIHLSGAGYLIIKKGYAWDGASGIPDTETNRQGALAHDALYQLLRGDTCPRISARLQTTNM